MSGAMFGLFLVIAFAVLDRIGSPLLWAAFWGTEAVQLAIAARVTWRRTRLFWTTIAAAHGAILLTCTAAVYLFGGYGTISAVPMRYMAFMGANGLATPIYHYVDSRFS